MGKKKLTKNIVGVERFKLVIAITSLNIEIAELISECRSLVADRKVVIRLEEENLILNLTAEKMVKS